MDWVRARRGTLLEALLTLSRAWVAAGKPVSDDLPTFGSFESWVQTVGAVLHWLGEKAFLGNLDETQQRQRVEEAEWEEFLLAWHDKLGAGPVTAAAIRSALAGCDGWTGTGLLDPDLLPTYLADAWHTKRDTFSRILGKTLRSIEGTRFGDSEVHVRRHGKQKRAVLWEIVVPNPPSEKSAT